MTVNLLDHFFVGFLFLVVPFISYFSIRKYTKAIKDGHTEMRMSMFRRIIIEEWGAVIVLAVYWFAIGRGASDLGLVLQRGGAVWGGYALGAI